MNSSNLENNIRCEICFETFEEGSKCPRILNCGHSYCHSCLERLLQSNCFCPICKSSINYKKAASVPINYNLLSVIETLRDKSISRPTVNEHDSLVNHEILSRPSKRILKSEGYCDQHSNYRELRCMDCEGWICGICVVVYHKKCRTLLVEEAYKELKKNVSLKVNEELKTRSITKNKITESLQILNKMKSGLVEELSDCEKHINKLMTLEINENNFCGNLKSLQTSIEISSNDGEFSIAKNAMDNLLQEEKSIKDDLQYLLLPLTLQKLIAWCQKEAVYTVENRYTSPIYGKLSFKDGEIRISSFLSEKPDAQVLDFRQILSNFTGSSNLPKKAFLQLKSNDGIFDKAEADEYVDVVIATDGVSPRARSFLLHCAALTGASYKKMSMNLHDSDSYLVYPGPIQVVKEIESEVCSTSLLAGDVHGMDEENSWFYISLQDRPHEFYPKIGIVVSDLNYLKKLNSNNFVIYDCGLVITPKI